MDFGEALKILRAGGSVSREEWNAAGQFVQMQVPDENSKMTLPYLYLVTGPNNKSSPNARVLWLASQDDMLALDWKGV